MFGSPGAGPHGHADAKITAANKAVPAPSAHIRPLGERPAQASFRKLAAAIAKDASSGGAELSELGQC